MIKVDFLTVDEIKGSNKLKVFDYYGPMANLSDYDILCGSTVTRAHPYAY